jgi:predicted RNA-binding Zn-ribbon protein involved in translation (DUF1610 family)
LIIDIVLVAAIGALAFATAFFFPSKAQIANNDTKRYKSMKPLIFVAGFAAMGIGALLVIFYLSDEEYQNIFNMINIPVYFALGATILVKNISQSKKIAAMESGMAPGVAAVQGVQPMVQPQVAGQQIGIKQTTAAVVQPQQVTAQQVGVQTVQPTVVPPQVATQQIGIKGTQPAPVQTQMVPAQPQPAPQPRIVVIKCPKCQGNMQINTAMLGQKMKCPHCGIEGKIG